MDPTRGMFQGLDIAASGMMAELYRARVVASNISNMHVVGGRGQEPYRRRGVIFEEVLDAARRSDGMRGERRASGVRVRQLYEDRDTPFVPRYEPGHPLADERGFVLTSNVDLFKEMVDMMTIERSFQANLAAMQSYKAMLRNSITQIGRS